MSSEALRDRLVADLRGRGSVLVAFSGGVDSALVAALAHEALGVRALALTAQTETLASRELDNARAVAGEIGIRHETVLYSELENGEFAANPVHRCYVCQGMRMAAMQRAARELGFEVVCDGTNASDPGADRPGLRAIRERGVYSPLLAHDVAKSAARQLAREMGLRVWDRPSNACLSSRLRHGEVVTLAKLRKVEAAEDLLHDAGFRVVRVRHEKGMARVEVGADEVARLQDSWSWLGPRLEGLGFRVVVLDSKGYREGGADSASSTSIASP